MTIVNKDGAPIASTDDIGLTVCSFINEKSIDLEKRTVDFVASTDVVDSYDEIVDQGSWILEDYLANPVVLWAHQSRELPIGRSVDVGLRSGATGGGVRLEHRVEFMTPDLNEKADQVFRMIPKFLKAVSVGFLPKTYRWEMRNNVEVFVWADCVLKEISVTPVGANPQALAKMKTLAVDLRKSAKDAGRALAGGNVADLARTLNLGGKLAEQLEERSTTTISIPLRSQSRAAQQTSPAASSGHETETPAATPQKEEKTMNFEQLYKDATENLTKSQMQVAELKLEAQKANEAKSAVEAKLVTSESTIKQLTTDKAALEKQNETLVTERDEAKARAEKAEGSLVEIEVDALVGKKITAAEREDFVELRKSNPTLFTKMVGQRSDLGVLTPPVIAGNQEQKGVAAPVAKNDADANADIVTEALKVGASA